MKRVVVTGGRNFRDAALVDRALSAIMRKHGISHVIEGEASGADTLSKRWAEAHGIEILPFPAAWEDLSHDDAIIKTRRDGTQYDARAGHRRNQQMIDTGKPDAAIAFPGGSGTEDMCRRLVKASVPIWDLRTAL